MLVCIVGRNKNGKRHLNHGCFIVNASGLQDAIDQIRNAHPKHFEDMIKDGFGNFGAELPFSEKKNVLWMDL